MAFDHSTFRTNANAVLATLTTLKAEVQAVVDQRQAHLDDPGEDKSEVHFIDESALTALITAFGPRNAGEAYLLMERLQVTLQRAIDESTAIAP